MRWALSSSVGVVLVENQPLQGCSGVSAPADFGHRFRRKRGQRVSWGYCEPFEPLNRTRRC